MNQQDPVSRSKDYLLPEDREARLIEALRWAVGRLGRRAPFKPEMPAGGGQHLDDWMEWAAALDLLKDAELSAQPNTKDQLVESEGEGWEAEIRRQAAEDRWVVGAARWRAAGCLCWSSGDGVAQRLNADCPWHGEELRQPDYGTGEKEGDGPKTFTELRDRFVDPEKERLRVDNERLAKRVEELTDACPHQSMTLTGDGNMKCDRCGVIEPDPFHHANLASQPEHPEGEHSDQGGAGEGQ